MVPFFFDRSPIARSIRLIGSAKCKDSDLAELLATCRANIDAVPYGYLDQILKRTDQALRSAQTQQRLMLLQELNRSALWKIQRVSIEGH